MKIYHLISSEGAYNENGITLGMYSTLDKAKGAREEYRKNPDFNKIKPKIVEYVVDPEDEVGKHEFMTPSGMCRVFI
jgi:hypothetical protein